MPKVTEQVMLEFRVGHGEGADGKKGERILRQYVAPQHAYPWRGLQGEGTPAWVGTLWIYQDGELVSVCPPAEGEHLPERATTGDALQLRAEVSRLEGHRTTLQQQLEVTAAQLRAAQEQLAGVQQALQHERERYARETAQLDDMVRRAREEAHQQRQDILSDVRNLRGEAAAIREDVVDNVKRAHAVLGEVHQHVAELREAEFVHAKNIATRQLQLERQCTSDLERYQTLALSPGRGAPSMGEQLIHGLLNSGVVSPDFILALVQTYRSGVAPGTPGAH